MARLLSKGDSSKMGDVGKERRLARRQLTTGANFFRSICEVLREVYDLVYTLEDADIRDKMTELLIDATVMAKKMDNRLGYYKKTYNDTTGKGGTGLQRLHDSGNRLAFRRKREAR